MGTPHTDRADYAAKIGAENWHRIGTGRYKTAWDAQAPLPCLIIEIPGKIA
jgi:hypothetical protein